jgi:hypothetical protein
VSATTVTFAAGLGQLVGYLTLVSVRLTDVTGRVVGPVLKEAFKPTSGVLRSVRDPTTAGPDGKTCATPATAVRVGGATRSSLYGKVEEPITEIPVPIWQAWLGVLEVKHAPLSMFKLANRPGGNWMFKSLNPLVGEGYEAVMVVTGVLPAAVPAD